jgi:hypothetical protein
MNKQFTELIQQLLENNFDQKIFGEVKFWGNSGLIEIVPFSGRTNYLKVFWGRLKLADQFALIDWIEINLGGKFYCFTYEPECEEQFISK